MDAKTKKYLFIGAVILVLLLIVFVIVKYMASKNQQAAQGSPATGATGAIVHTVNTVTGGNYISEKFPLDLYMYGDNVGKYQHYLNLKGAGITADGKFGPKTQSKSLAITGSKTVTQDQFDKYMAELDGGPAANLTSNQSTLPNPSTDRQAYVAALYNDLVVKTYWTGRNSESANGIYSSVASLNTSLLKSVAQAYKADYGRELITDINSALFSVTDPIDETIVTNLQNVGYKLPSSSWF